MRGEDIHISHNGFLDAFTGIAVFMGKSGYIFWIYCVTDRETKVKNEKRKRKYKVVQVK